MLVTVLAFSAVCWVVGTGGRLALMPAGIVIRSLGITLGLGLSLIGTVTAVSFFLVDDPVLLLWPLFAASVLAVPGGLALILRSEHERAARLRSFLPSLADLAALVAAVFVLLPLIGHGHQYWTNGTNDFPSYASSVEVWLGDSGHAATSFLQRHPDNFGALQQYRGTHEKPIVTGIMLVASKVANVDPWELLGPLTLIFLFVLFAALLAVARRLWGMPALVTAACVLVPACSIVPMSRVFDAQIGQGAATALLAVLIAVVIELVGAEGSPPRPAIIGAAAICGAVAAAALGSNATLVVGTAGIWGALLACLIWRTRPAWRVVWNRLLLAATAAALLSLPMLTAYLDSIDAQSTGEQGFDVPLAGPLSLLGLQLKLTVGAGTSQTVVAWLALIGAFVCGAVVFARKRVHTPMVVMTGAAIVNVAVIMLRLGTTNYGGHKSMAISFALVAPLLLVHIVSRVPREHAVVRSAAVAGLAVASAIVAFRAADRVEVMASDTLVEAAEDPRVADAGVVNIDLGDGFENSIAALAADADQVVVTGSSYALKSVPVGSTFLLEAEQAEAWEAEVVPLEGDYVLATVDLSVVAGEPVLFDTLHPSNARYLYEAWYPLEPGGVWSGSRSSSASVVVDLPPDLRDQDVDVLIEGTRYTAESEPRELRVSVNGTELHRETYTSFDPREIALTVPRSLIDEASGRVVLTIDSPKLVSPSHYDLNDRRSLGFLLESMTVDAVPA